MVTQERPAEASQCRPRGGRRPGAGRKRAATNDYQFVMRSVVERVVTAEEWEAAIRGMLAAVAQGDAKAFSVLAPYVMGAAPKEVTHRTDADHPMVFVIG